MKSKTFLNKTFSVFKGIIYFAFFLVLIPLVFYYCYLWGHRILEGPMLGGDTAYHMSWILTLNRSYPEINVWFPFAGAGSSIILGYWVFSYYLAIVSSHLTSFTPEQMVRFWEFITVPIVCCEIYLYLWIRTKNLVIGFLGALLYPLSSMAWGWISQAGFFAMQMSTIIYVPVFLFFDLFLEAELKEQEKTAKKYSFLLGFMIFQALGFLIHGSVMPNFFLGIPVYALLRSQLLPRMKEKRIFSFLRAIKVLLITGIFTVLSGAYIFLPQQRYFGLQPFVSVYGVADTPILPWKGFLGIERLPLWIGSLYWPLYLSFLVSFFGLIGMVFALIKRHFFGALGLMVLFYVWWLSSARFLAGLIPQTQILILPTATRAASVTAIYFTLLAAYGLWSIADLPSAIITFFGKKLRGKGTLGGIACCFVQKFAFLLSTVLVIGLTILSFNKFKTIQTYKPLKVENIGEIGPYRGYGTFGIESFAPLCFIPGWQKEITSGMNCEEHLPKRKIDKSDPDFWPKEFSEAVKNLNLNRNTRVSVSSFLGWVVFSFATHTDASLASAPSGQSVINLDYLGMHDKVMFLEGKETTQEVAETAKWWGTKYVFLTASHKDVYPEAIWPVKLENSGVVVREFLDSTGIANLSNKPSVLVIGSEKNDAYILAYRAATKGGMSFDQGILIEGKEKIDDYKIEELKKYQLIVLQGYTYNNKAKAWQLMSKYVEEGGSLYVDTGWQYISKDWGKGPDNTGKFLSVSLPEPFPVKKTLWGNMGSSWDKATLETEVGNDVDLQSFGELGWRGEVWGMSLANKGDLQSWAKPVLTSGNKVFLAMGNFGKGRVVWSGMNLFSHAFDKDSKAEYKLINNIFNFLLPDYVIERGEVDFNWITSDKAEFLLKQIPKDNAILYFADSYTPDWKAYIENNGQKDYLQINKAGPRFKAIRVDGLASGQKLILEYKTKNVFLLSAAVTIISFFVVLMIIFDGLIFKGKLINLLKGVFEKSLFSLMFNKKKMGAKLKWDEEE